HSLSNCHRYISFFELYIEYDPFFTPPEVQNPWLSDSAEFWEYEKQVKDVSARRVKRWAFSLKELLADPAGREHFSKFLEKEFSGENLKFWEAVQKLKTLPQQEVPDEAKRMWDEFLGPDASIPINVDGKSFEATKKNVEENPDRWCYDEAAAHVYHLMKTDSYSRYVRSPMYTEFLSGSKKKTSVKGIRSIVSFSGRKEAGAT
ncbi:regulator of G-protein signaling 7-like, partial [Frankliniella occidentalis]|uniref:Regulator of G-protein signaling 7-like n=1 Tax=Frankliniella occidentalis TaxID=133901 RepID=A0A9C6X9F8_FRAOC